MCFNSQLRTCTTFPYAAKAFEPRQWLGKRSHVMYRITCSAFSRATCHIANETAPLAYRAKLTNKLYSVQLKNVLHCILLIVIQFKSPNETFSLEHFRAWIVRDDDWWLDINFFFIPRCCLDRLIGSLWKELDFVYQALKQFDGLAQVSARKTSSNRCESFTTEVKIRPITLRFPLNFKSTVITPYSSFIRESYR